MEDSAPMDFSAQLDTSSSPPTTHSSVQTRASEVQLQVKTLLRVAMIDVVINPHPSLSLLYALTFTIHGVWSSIVIVRQTENAECHEAFLPWLITSNILVFFSILFMAAAPSKEAIRNARKFKCNPCVWLGVSFQVSFIGWLCLGMYVASATTSLAENDSLGCWRTFYILVQHLFYTRFAFIILTWIGE